MSTMLNSRRMLFLLALLAACGGDGRTVLTVYSPHGANMLGFFERAFEAEHPDVDVQSVDMGSQEVLDRLRAERANPQADVWFGAPAEIFDRGAGEGLLEAYTPTWREHVEEWHPEGYWYAMYLTPEVIAYNTEAVSRDEAPKDWDDVLDPRWSGRVLIRDPIPSGTMRAIFGGIIAREAQRTGSFEAGYEWLRRLDANTKEYVLNPTLLYQKLARQEGLITLWDMPDIAMLKGQRGMPIDYVIPAGGTPVVVDAIGIVRGTGQPELAQRYYEFVTSPEMLRVAADSFARIPARTDIPAESLPDWIREAREEIRPMPGDQALIRERMDEWMRYWDANIRNRSRR
ncbi:MAG TPA: extracellular solute-binding protein [Gemmatimonadaceae bacterium]|nr:extracellular solute-binding protein [Gemmatimonadaceae bacterium]